MPVEFCPSPRAKAAHIPHKNQRAVHTRACPLAGFLLGARTSHRNLFILLETDATPTDLLVAKYNRAALDCDWDSTNVDNLVA